MTTKDKIKASLHRQIVRQIGRKSDYWRAYRDEIHRHLDCIAWREVDCENTPDSVLIKRQCLDELMSIVIVKLRLS